MISASWILFWLMAWDDPQGRADRPSPDQRYQALADRYESDRRAYVEASAAAKTAEETKALSRLQERQDLKVHAPGFLALADEYPRSKGAEDALLWMATHATFLTKDGEGALRRLVRDHARSERLGPALTFQGRIPTSFESTEAFFRGVLAPPDAPARDRPVRGCPTSRVYRGEARGGGLHHEPDPSATEGPPAVEYERSLRELTGALTEVQMDSRAWCPEDWA